MSSLDSSRSRKISLLIGGKISELRQVPPGDLSVEAMRRS
jgi:hypothetical protein